METTGVLVSFFLLSPTFLTLLFSFFLGGFEEVCEREKTDVKGNRPKEFVQRISYADDDDDDSEEEESRAGKMPPSDSEDE